MFGLTTLGLGFSIIAVMYWRRNGLLAYLEVDERLARWLKRRSGGLVAEKGSNPSKGSGRVPAPSPRPSRTVSPTVGDAFTQANEASQAFMVEGVSRYFGGLRAVHEVNLSLARGEILGLIGPNGAGKTTLLNLIAGADRVSSGRILSDGADITAWPAHLIARQGIGRTFQSIRLFSNLTVLENVVAGATGSRADLGSSTPEEWALQIIRRFDLDGFIDQMAATLAYGHQRTLEIARALAIRPRYLLLDEPGAAQAVFTGLASDS